MAIGLVNRVVPPGEVMATARDFARRISLGAPMALAKTKETMVRSNGRPLEEAFAIESQCTKDNAADGGRERGAARVHGEAAAAIHGAVAVAGIVSFMESKMGARSARDRPGRRGSMNTRPGTNSMM